MYTAQSRKNNANKKQFSSDPPSLKKSSFLKMLLLNLLFPNKNAKNMKTWKSWRYLKY